MFSNKLKRSLSIGSGLAFAVSSAVSVNVSADNFFIELYWWLVLYFMSNNGEQGTVKDVSKNNAGIEGRFDSVDSLQKELKKLYKEKEQIEKELKKRKQERPKVESNMKKLMEEIAYLEQKQQSAYKEYGDFFELECQIVFKQKTLNRMLKLTKIRKFCKKTYENEENAPYPSYKSVYEKANDANIFLAKIWTVCDENLKDSDGMKFALEIAILELMQLYKNKTLATFFDEEIFKCCEELRKEENNVNVFDKGTKTLLEQLSEVEKKLAKLEDVKDSKKKYESSLDLKEIRVVN